MVNSEYYMVKDNGPRGGSNIHEGIYIAGRIIIISLHIESIINYIANQLCSRENKKLLLKYSLQTSRQFLHRTKRHPGAIPKK